MTSEEIQAIFFVECEESLAAAEAGLAACKAGTQDADTVNAVFRGVHSIKGGAGAFGYAALQAYTHTFETLLSDVREGTVALSDDLIDLLLRALDTLSDHVASARDGGNSPDDAGLLAELTAARGLGAPAAAAAPQPAAPPPPEAPEPGNFDADFDLDSLLDDIVGEASPSVVPAWQLHLRPHAEAMRNGSEPLSLLRELGAMGANCLVCDLSHLPELDALDPAQGYLGWTFTIPGSVSEAEVGEIFDFVKDEWGIAAGAETALPPPRLAPVAVLQPALAAPAASPSAAPVAGLSPEAGSSSAPPAAGGQSIRIDLAKLDRLIDTVGELVIAQAMLAQRLGGSGMADEELLMLDGLTREIQESAMAIRAQPIGTVFSRVPRILRELASSTGKHVRLDVIGETTELDKTVIERLGEPLTHLIRNAVDHGIESADERLAQGKPAEGTLTLSAEQRSGRILICIADDGKGIDRQRVFEKAVEKGIVAPDAQLSPEEIDSLIFAPGFSTAATVTSVSGRGVGMDVVRQNVKDLGGRIMIESEQGKGTKFILALPLTLAIADGMIVTVGDQALVLPLTHVVESLLPSDGEVQQLGTGRQMLNVRGRFIPVIPVGARIGRSGASLDAADGVLIVVDTQSAGQAALLVDGIVDQRQFVIKSLETNFKAVEGVAGATILGDGQVALILDVDGLVQRALEPAPLREAA